MSEKYDKHWWEFYGVRYAQGTVIGAMLVFFLFSENEGLRRLLFLPSDPKDFGMPHLILLAVYGLVYCYIASAPILIMHACRGLLFKSTTMKSSALRLSSVFAIPLLASCLYIKYTGTNQPLDLAKTIAIFLFSMLTTLQIVMLVSVFTTSTQEIIDYYICTIKKRSKHNNTDYVESYKHIREHGNSFLIVLFQFFLAYPIFIFVSQEGASIENSVSNLLTIIVVWIFPACTIWFFGNKLESNLKNM